MRLWHNIQDIQLKIKPTGIRSAKPHYFGISRQNIIWISFFLNEKIEIIKIRKQYA